MAFYPSDWLAGTRFLPRLHRSVYFDVCCYIWDTGKPCPPVMVAGMVADLPNGQEIIDDLVSMEKLVRNTDGSLENAKAMVEAEKALRLHSVKSAGGKAARSAGSTHNKSAGGSDTIEPEPEPEISPSGDINPNPFAGEAWDGWIESRKKKPTDRAIQLVIKELAKLQAQGHDPNKVLDQSTMNGWTGVFPLKRDNGNGNGYGDRPSGPLEARRRARGQ